MKLITPISFYFLKCGSWDIYNYMCGSHIFLLESTGLGTHYPLVNVKTPPLPAVGTGDTAPRPRPLLIPLSLLSAQAPDAWNSLSMGDLMPVGLPPTQLYSFLALPPSYFQPLLLCAPQSPQLLTDASSLILKGKEAALSQHPSRYHFISPLLFSLRHPKRYLPWLPSLPQLPLHAARQGLQLAPVPIKIIVSFQMPSPGGTFQAWSYCIPPAAAPVNHPAAHSHGFHGPAPAPLTLQALPSPVALYFLLKYS